MRIVRRILTFLLLSLMLTAGPAWAFFSLSGAKNAMVDFLLEQLSTEGVFEITAEEVTELDDGSTAITGLQIADADGVWFTAEALSFQWNPKRLLRGEVEFNALVMSGIKIARKPLDPPAVDVKEDTGPPEADHVFAWPRSPLTLRIDRMALERVEIAEPVLGHAIAFDAEGSAVDEGEIQSVSLAVKRTDSVAGTITFSYTRNFDDDTLKMDVKADEAEGGLVADLAGLPQDAASRLTVTADGPPSDWRAVFDLDLAETIAADGKAAISYEGPLKIDVALTAHPGRQLEPDLAALLGERAELVARISQETDGSIRIAEGRLQSPEMKLTASGTFAPTSGTSDLKISFHAGGRLAEPLEGVDFRLVKFDGHVTGPIGAIHAEGDLRLEGLRTAPADVETAVLEIDVRADEGVGPQLIVMDVSGATTGLRIDQLGADVLGDAKLAIKGRLLGQALSLETASLDSKALTIKAAGKGNLDPAAFDLDFELSAPDLKPVAGAYDMPADGAINLAGQFHLKGEDIRLKAGAELRDFEHPMAGARRLRLDGTVEKSGDDIQVDLTGRGEALRLDKVGPDVLGDPVLAVKARVAGETLTLETASLDSKVLKLKADGTGFPATPSYQINLELSAPELSGVARVYGVEASGAVDLKGVFRQYGDDITIVASTDLGNFEHPMASARLLRLNGSVEMSDGTTTVDLTGRGEALRLDKLGPDVLGDPELAISGVLAGDALTLKSATLDSKVVSLKAAGTGDLAASNFDFDVDVSAPDLAAMARVYGVEASGAIELKGKIRQQGETLKVDAATQLRDFAHPSAEAKSLRLDGSVAMTGGTIDFDVKGRGEAVRLDRVDAELLPQATLAARGALTDGTLTLEKFNLASPLLTAKASGELALETTTGRVSYDIAMPDLAVVARRYDVPLAGALSMHGDATLPRGRAPRLDGEVAIDGLAYDGTNYGRLALAHDVDVSEAPAGKIGVRLRDSPYGDVRLDTGFAYAAPSLTLSEISLGALGLAATGDLALDIDAPLADGTLKITAQSLSPAGKLAGTPLAGNGWGTVMLSSSGAKQDVDVALNLRGLAVGDTRIGAAEIVAKLRDVLDQPAVDTRLRVTGIEAGDILLDTARLTARGPLTGLAINAETSGTMLDKPMNAGLDARVSVGGPTTTARVTRLAVTLAEDRTALTAPLQITVSGGLTRVQGLSLTLPDSGSVAGDLTIDGRPVAGNLTLRLPRLDFIKRFAEIPVKKGSLDADLAFDRRGGKGSFNVAGLEFEDVDAPGAINITGAADWAGQRLSLDLSADGGFGEPVRATARLPLAYDGGLPQPARRGPLEGRLSWKGEIGELWSLVPAPGHVVTGNSVIDLGVGGDISNPKLTGGIEITAGSYQNLDLGTILTDLTLGTELLGGGDLGLNLSAKDGASGQVTVDGRVALDASGIDLTTKIDRAVLVRRDDVVARIDGDITIKGPVTGLDVIGKLEIQDAEVRLVSSATPSIVTLEDVRIKGEKPKPKREKTSGVTLDITISSTDRIFVRGRGLDSQWGVDLHITGDAAAPVITGAVEKVRGTLSLVAKEFQLERGSVRFDGGQKIDPRIDVALTRTTSDLSGGIVVTGTASDPRLAFTSTPSLPEDEVMPRLLFGKSSQSLTGSQGIQLAIGLATLMNGGGGTLDAVRSTVGLDQLNITEDEDGNAAVRLGKEVAEGVFVGTETELDGSGTKVTVEIDVFDDFKLDADVGSDGNTGVGFQWKKDF